MQKFSGTLRRAIAAGSPRRFAAAAQKSAKEAEHISTGRSGIENQGKHFWEAPFSPSEWKGNESGIVALGVSGVAVYFLLDYWLKSKYENRGALAEVAKPDHPSNPGRERMTPKDAGEAMIPIGVGKEPAESKAPSHADKPSK